MKIFKFIIFIALLAMYSCQPENVDLGSVLSADDLQFSVTQDSSDPNLVYLESKTEGVTPLWQTPMGRSTSVYDTLKIAFKGDYQVIYGVESAGGYVESTDTFNFTLTTNNLSYVDDDLWTYLCGGVGSSKTWLLDLDEDGVSRYFNGPLYYYGTDDSWETVTEGEELGDDADSWSWEASYDASWMMEAGDYGTMTFSLTNSASIEVNNPMLGDTWSGSYYLDVDEHTLALTDAEIIHDATFADIVTDWSNVTVLALTEDVMQLAVLRDNSDEGECLLSYNFISQDYFDNYVADDTEEEPDLPDGWKDDISAIYSIKWVLSDETPFNWAELDGSLMYDWSSASDYESWTGFDASVPDSYADFSLTMNSLDGTVDMVLPDGTESSGTYTLDDDGIYTFSGINPYFQICSDNYLTVSADTTWQILDVEYEDGNVSGMWVGVLSDDESQYMCYLLVPETSGSSDTEESGTELTVDNSKILYGNLETDNDKYRIEIYNAYGNTSTDSPIDPDAVIIDNKVEITFSISGLTFVDGAVGSYETSGYLVNSDWTGYVPSQSIGSGTEATITGDGTYTVTYYPAVSIDGTVVFVIDFPDMVPDISDIDAVTATIDSVVMY